MKRFFDRQLSLVLIIAMLFTFACVAEGGSISAADDPLATEDADLPDELISAEVEAAPEELPEMDLSYFSSETDAAPDDLPEADSSGNDDRQGEIIEADELAAPAEESGDPAEADAQAIPEKLVLGKGETYSFGLENATVTSNKESIVSVDAEGNITAVKKGSAKVTIKVGDNEPVVCKVKVRKAPKKVTLSKDQLTMIATETFTLKAKLPRKSASHQMTWESSNPEVATVDSEGVVTAVGAGTVEITVTTFNMKQATCSITVFNNPITIAFPMESIVIGKGESVTIKPVVSEEENLVFTWSSKKRSVAKVDQEGTITGKKADSSTTITVETQTGEKAKLKVKVRKAPKSVSLSDATVEAGSTVQLTAELPKKTASYTLTWESSDNGIATVDEHGVVAGVKAGAVQITVTTFNGKSATCTVTVTGNAEPEPTPTPVPSDNIFIMANGVVTGYTGDGGDIVIPLEDDEGNAITAIAAEAFLNDTAITSVSIPATVIEIGESAFEGCSCMESVEIPNAVQRIGKAAFKGCNKLASMTVFG